MHRNTLASLALLALIASAGFAQDQVDTAFSYQGQLKQNNVPVTGTANFIFSLWDAPTGGNQIGNYIESPSDYPVMDGLFTIELEFTPTGGWIYDGTDLWMEVSVDYPSGSGTWETLAPRQHLTATPYASFATVATAAPWAGILDMPADFADGVDDVGDGLFWSLTGNAGTTAGTNFLGTTDDEPLELHVNGARAMRFEPVDGYPNVIGGRSDNYASANALSATIGGGRLNSVHAWQATIGGGVGNEAHANNTTIAGGDYNVIGDVAAWATISGGQQNEATQEYAMIPGGQQNFAGGEYCLAAGRRAKVRGPDDVGGGDTNGDEGTFVWADATGDEFWSTGPNQFLIRATGGVGIGTNAPPSNTALCVDDPSKSYAISGHGSSYGVKGTFTGGSAGAGVRAEASGGGSGDGIQVVSNGRSAVRATATDTADGVWAQAAGIESTGVYAEATSTEEYWEGEFLLPSYYGIQAIADGPSGVGLHASGGYWGASISSDHTAVNANGGNIGVDGYASDGVGVYGSGDGGVYGYGSDWGMYGRTGDGYGVWGEADDTGGVAIYGTAYLGHADAAQFNGDVAVNGDFEVVFPGTKNFVQPHPNNPGLEIVYVCLEGGENGVYVRGSGQLSNGQAEIELPEHFSLVAAEAGITAQVTPVEDCRGIFVTEKSPGRIVVREMQGGASNARFDYLVMGVRLGCEEHEAIREAKRVQPDGHVSQEEYEERMARPENRRAQELLIQNGTLNADGTINLDTAEALGWRLGPKTRAERLERLALPKHAEDAGE